MTLNNRPAPGELAVDAGDGPADLGLIRVDFLVGPVESFTITNVSGGGGGSGPIINGYGGGGTPISISSTSTNYHRTFIPTPQGKQVPLTLNAQQHPLAEGQWASVIWGTREGAPQALAYFLNQDTDMGFGLNGPGDQTVLKTAQSTTFWHHYKRGFRVLFILVLACIVLAGFALTIGPQPSEQPLIDLSISLASLTVLAAIAALIWAPIGSIIADNRLLKQIERAAEARARR